METPSQLGRIAGSVCAGVVGFGVGFYAGFFLLLGIWGLETDQLAFVLVAGGVGVLFSGVAIAFTVSSSRRWTAIATAVGIGVVLLPVLLLVDADPAALAIGGLILVVLTATLVRTGAFEPSST